MRLIAALCAAGVCWLLIWGPARADKPVAILKPPVARIDGQPTPPSEETTAVPVVEKTVEPDKEATSTKPRPTPIPEFFGDQAPIGSLIILPHGQMQSTGSIFVPSARYFKISDNDSPRPQTRRYFSFNYFYNLNGTVNQAAGPGIEHTRIHREIWGWEWANDDGSASVGLRLPLTTFNAANNVPGLDGTSTDLGDLTVIFKWLLWENSDGSLLSAGLAVTPPTGPGSFAGSNHIQVFHNTCLQPYCGWIWTQGNFYLQGFTALDAPTDLGDVVMLSNSLAAGYFLYQNRKSSSLTSVVPTVEVHVNTPLTHRGVLGLTDPVGTPDMVHLTGGIHFEYQDRSSSGIAFAMPVTGPRMFDFEILAQVRWRY